MSNPITPDAELAESGAAMVQRAPVTELSQETKEQLELARQFVSVVGAIGSMSWGRGLTPGIRKAISEYCRVYDVDPLTELDILGGSFYVNSEWFIRKLGDMRRRGEVEEFWLEHIQADQRLREIIDDEASPPEARDEAQRRWTYAKFSRVQFNVPEQAAAVCVCYIRLPGNRRPITGCKWGGNGTSIQQPRGSGGSAPNPIVEANATLSVESQAIRRAVRQIASHVGTRLPDFDSMERDLTALSARSEAVIEKQADVNARLEAEARPPKALGAQAFVGYADRSADMDKVPVPREAAVAEAERAVRSVDDPYRDEGNRDPRGFGEGNRSDPGPVDQALEVPLGVLRGESVTLSPELVERLKPTPLRSTAPAVDLNVETTVVVTCGECGIDVRIGHAEDHKSSCSKYAD